MKRNLIKTLLIVGFAAGSLTACKKNLILTPNTQLTSAQVYSTPTGYTEALAKVYGSYALTGNIGPAGPTGEGDVQGIDEGTSDFFRLFWYAQELPTDEAVIGWGDPGVPDFHNMSWGSSNIILTGLYYRSMYQITLCNDFISQCTDAKLSSRGISGQDATNIKEDALEARFLRAYQYWVMMDLFANPPFVTDATPVGSVIPPQTDRKTLFAYVESELKAIEPLLPANNDYGKASKGAADALLARLYLNAQVYTGTARYTDAVTYSQKVISSGVYSLASSYTNLFTADNNTNGTQKESILTINYDGLKTQGYGGTTFLTHASAGGTLSATLMGDDSQWAGIRTTSNIVSLFPADTVMSLQGNTTKFPNRGDVDSRAEIWTNGQNETISTISSFSDGYAVSKFRNIKSDGTAASSLSFSDVDMPIFRLAEQYLIYAEAVLRGGTGGDAGTALGYINLLRYRAYGNNSGNITAGELNVNFILDERARELYWEGFRRTDLIRYGEFTSATYLWPFKGGAKSGVSVSDYRNIYPIPDQDRAANPNLKQNTGYGN